MDSFSNVNINLVMAYERGSDAYLNHQPLDSNPYPVAATDLTKAGMAWEAGWKSQWYKAGAPPQIASQRAVLKPVTDRREEYIDEMLLENGISVKTVMRRRRELREERLPLTK
jgi:hypothetical protein